MIILKKRLQRFSIYKLMGDELPVMDKQQNFSNYDYKI